MGWEAQEEGYVAAILVPDGSKDIQVGTPVIVVVEEPEMVPPFANFTAADAAAAAAAPAATPAPSAAPPPAAAPAAAAAAAPKSAAQAAAPAAPGARVIASPLAKKMASEAGVSLSGIAGSGPGGRIIAEDVTKVGCAHSRRPLYCECVCVEGGHPRGGKVTSASGFAFLRWSL